MDVCAIAYAKIGSVLSSGVHIFFARMSNEKNGIKKKIIIN